MSGKKAPRWSIRPATHADARAATKLWTEAYVTEGSGGRTEPYVERDFFDAAEWGSALVAELNGAVVGIVVLFPPGVPRRAVALGDEAELARLAVAAHTRRNGIGRALTLRCAEHARAEGWRAIALWSRPYQAAAHRLYQSLGYRRAPERDTTDATGHGRLVFVLDLAALPE
jgi:ribosomal protein S18 acetylase RimI-like enzyme